MKLDKTIQYTKRRVQNNQRAPKPVKAKRIEPLPEQQAKGDFQSAGMAYKRVPVIETMLLKKQITTAEYISLSYYRVQAIAADRSPIRSNIDFTVRSGNQRPIGYATPQEIETARIEVDLGKLKGIVRAIAVDDLSLSEYCVARYGGKEVVRGDRVVILPTRKVRDSALDELRMGVERIRI